MEWFDLVAGEQTRSSVLHISVFSSGINCSIFDFKCQYSDSRRHSVKEIELWKKFVRRKIRNYSKRYYNDCYNMLTTAINAKRESFSVE